MHVTQNPTSASLELHPQVRHGWVYVDFTRAIAAGFCSTQLWCHP
jgi:hypothetical protein